MNNELRILHLEDNPVDAELVRETLKAEGITCEIVCVETREDFIKRLEEFAPDLILTDQKLPAFDGLSALQIVKERRPDLPVIFVTGSMGEEWAVASLKKGATDYVLKDKLYGLAPAISRALKEVEERAERELTEAALLASEQRYKRLIESVTNYIYTVEIKDGRAVSTKHGPGCVAVTGYRTEEYDADPYLWYRMVYEEDRTSVIEQANQILSGESIKFLEHRVVHKNGSKKWVRNTVVPRYDKEGHLVSYDGLIEDITERKKLEQQLRHAQKMEAIGTLAGGIAHDFNNIVNIIMGYGTMVYDSLEAGSPSKEQMNEVLTAADRAANLSKRLLLFSRKEVAECKPLSVNELVINMEKMLSRIIGEDINLIADLMGTKALVMVDDGQMEQVLMNLATNARDAMPKGGSLTISTEIREIDDEFIKAYEYGAPGTYAVISVTDTGTGIDKEKQSRIFDPFFTTKEVGKGTGLGLSIAYGIIKQHNGCIKVYSEPGRGTTFKIWLPVVEDKAEKKLEVEACSSPKGGTETILVAEDDTSLRSLTRLVLESSGYKVITAEDGEDALTRFMENKDRIALVVLDMIMPKKSGKEAYEEISKVSPGIKTLFLSGYTMDLIKTQGIIEAGLDFIHKPARPRELLRKVREALDKKSEQ